MSRLLVYDYVREGQQEITVIIHSPYKSKLQKDRDIHQTEFLARDSDFGRLLVLVGNTGYRILSSKIRLLIIHVIMTCLFRIFSYITHIDRKGN